MQKTWLCLKEGIASFKTPTSHREKLGLKSSYTHDHNPLNDARRIADFYLQTIEQMRSSIEEPKNIKSKTISVVEYDPEWPKVFQIEADQIKSALGVACNEVVHV